MAQYAKLEIVKREQSGSKAAKAMRKEGKIPVNFYYAGEDNINFTIDKKVFRKVIQSGHHIFEVDINNSAQYVMIKEVQYHPVNDEIIHIDLMRVRRDVKMTIFVPIVLEGTAIGVKEGGIMTQNLSTIEISCLPADVPDHIVVDVSDFELYHVMKVSELSVDDKIEIMTAADMDVLAVITHREESLEPEIPTDEEMAEAEAGDEAIEGEEPVAADETTDAEGKEETNEK
ncbi:MAG: 50S ribosomal protein L25 [Candidatus Marinimicrobia bacterium]|nr:50S ribosomal protein L25 [Candidatus Neomarinimicrobiota bacterium]